MRSRFFRIISIVLILQLQQVTRSYGYIYVVREGDTLSQVAGALIPGPVWRKDGSLLKVLSLNPEIANPHTILPGEEINLGDLLSERAEKDQHVLSHKTVVTSVPAAQVRAPAALETPVAPAAPIACVAAAPASRSLAEVQNPEGTAHADEDDDGTRTRFEVSPFAALTSITSTDLASGSKATVSSSVYVGANLKFSQIFSDTFRTYLQTKLSYISFEAPIQANSSISTGGKFLTSFGLGADYKLTSRFSLGLSFDLEKDLFVRATSTSSVAVDSVVIPTLGAKFTYDIVKRNAFLISTSAIYEEKFGASTDLYKVNLGRNYGGLLEVTKRKHQEEQYRVGLGAYYRKQSTSATDQSELKYEMSVHIPFGTSSP